MPVNKIFIHMIILLFLSASSLLSAENIYSKDRYQSFVSDERASKIGDVVTLLIIENSEASSSNGQDSDKSLGLGINYSVTNDRDDLAAAANIGVGSDKNTARSGSLTAQVSVSVYAIDQAGKLFVKGKQQIVVNGEEQLIRVEGWLRPRDINSNNVAISTRLSDVKIEYTGYDVDRDRQGVFGKMFSWLGF